MAENYIDYDVVMNASKTYHSQAEALANVVQTLTNTNAEMQAGFKNETSNAFIERYESEYKKALEKAGEALQSISDFLKTYVNNRIAEDEGTAGNIAG